MLLNADACVIDLLMDPSKIFKVKNAKHLNIHFKN